ncbi:serine/threonine protein kinase [Roseibium hamelinense]|uniref:Serine/threonine protein kinase n=1 Tax=Roseibium hamelinense TaxID=150831 RepID=A0A562SE56_9HYPH|nr:serine/threonine-protein kinase [Roseibium hamelinense]MTI42554.1 serine/threonine protein kinase [Roseibium hamelinense]TWI79567.1 serine/threonine protein kinase [Roseibium hamelinense]
MPDVLQAFLGGRLSYDDLLRALRDHATKSDTHALESHKTIREAVELGKLPQDLGQIIIGQLPNIGGAASSSGEQTTAPFSAADQTQESEDDLDPPTIPNGATTAAPANASSPNRSGQQLLPPLPYLMKSPATAGEEMRERVDDVVLGSLVGGFKEFRKARESGDTGQSGYPASEQVDNYLTSFRSARLRSDARRAAAGQSKGPASLEDLAGSSAATAGIGSILRDRFVLDDEIGRGGMGVVYSAVDRRRLEAGHNEPYVALKLLNEVLRTDAIALRLMEAEARKAQALAHPNITTVFDFDRDGSEAFIIMELLKGKPLDRYLAQSIGRGRPMEDCRTIIEGICSGLAYAHSQDVIHSDLKPGNVFISGDKSAKLLDFGLAAAAKAAEPSEVIQEALTSAYASPEMLAGAERDPRDDIFALGCIAYQLLSGTHPFGMQPALEAAKNGVAPRPIDGLTESAAEAITGALQFEREARTKTAALFQDQFSRP